MTTSTDDFSAADNVVPLHTKKQSDSWQPDLAGAAAILRHSIDVQVQDGVTWGVFEGASNGLLSLAVKLPGGLWVDYTLPPLKFVRAAAEWRLFETAKTSEGE